MQPQPSFFHARPALGVLLAFLIGALLAPYASYAIVLIALVCALLLLVYLSWQRTWSVRTMMVGGLGVVSLSALQYLQYDREYESSDLRALADSLRRPSILSGVVDEHDRLPNSDVIVLHRLLVSTPDTSRVVAGKLAVFVRTSVEDSSIALPSVGDHVRVLGELEPLSFARNPFEDSYDLHIRREYDVVAKATLHSRFDILSVVKADPSLLDRVEGFRTGLLMSFEQSFVASLEDRDALAFAKAIVLGIRSELPTEIRQRFSMAGLTHLLAISGFNIAIVALLITQLLTTLGLRRTSIRYPVSMVAIAGYCWLVGFQPSVLRAFVMVELILLAKLLERTSDLANLAAFTALLHLAIRPSVLYDLGFQLSYAAVFGFALFYSPLQRLVSPRPNVPSITSLRSKAIDALLLTISAFMGTAPVLATHFGSVSFVSILANLPAVPIASLLTVLCFVLLPISMISMGLAKAYGVVVTLLTDAIIIISDLAAQMTGLHVRWAVTPVVLIAVILVVLYAMRAQTLRSAGARASLAVPVVASTLLFLPLRATAPSQGKLLVLFADVGQGDATILRTPGERWYLFDFGNARTLSLRPSTYHAALLEWGVTDISGGFITHLHRDHFGGAIESVHRYPVDRLYTSGGRSSDPLALSLDSACVAEKVEVQELHTGDTIRLDDDVTAYVLAPESSGSGISNDRSLVIKVCYGSTSVLLTGDIESEAEASIVARYGSFLKSSIVKAPHHGSRSSSTPSFVAASDPDHLVISCGSRNRFGHPHREVLRRWSHSGSAIHRTDRSGAIMMESDGEKVRLIPWKD